MSPINAAIFILTQNNSERKIYLKTCLYFLFKNFNKNYKYPIIILHEGDYDQRAQEEIVKSVREPFRDLISFKEIDKTDFQIPDHIDKEKVKQIVEIQPIPYWRNISYRLMCNFWMNHFMKYTNGFDYVMRLDDDSIIEEPLLYDVFELMISKKLVYMSNIIHVDCGLCNYGMKELFENISPEFKESLDRNKFIPGKLSEGSEYFDKFKKVVSIVEGKECTLTEFQTQMPLMYYNNFFITSTEFWNRPTVKYIIDKINHHGGIFYYRYGDAPLQTLIVSLLQPEATTRAVFKYSKRLQREVFIDGNNNMHSYMPKSYDHSSCVTNK